MAEESASFPRSLEEYRSYLTLLAHVNLEPPLRSKFDSADFVQQTLLKAYENRAEFRGSSEAELAAWLRRILANTMADAVRQFLAAEKRNLQLERSIDESSQRLEQWLQAAGGQPADQAIRQEQMLHLAAALTELPVDQRTALMRRYLEGMSVGEVAESMGRTRPMVVGLLTRGLQRLRERMGEHW